MNSILACSGSHAAAVVTVSEIAGYLSAGFSLFATAVLFFHHFKVGRREWIAFYAILLLLHPAWTLGARAGDCGILKLLASAFVAYLFARFLQRRHSAILPSDRDASSKIGTSER